MPDTVQRSAPERHRVSMPWVDALDPPQPHVVYLLRGLLPGVAPTHDAQVIYVGVTSHLRQRLYAHARKWWWVAVVPALCEFDPHTTREAAEACERTMIRCYQPAMNRAGRLLVVGR